MEASLKTTTKSTNLDLLGIILSFACVLHCLFFPILLALLPSLSVFWGNEWIHVGLVISLLPIAIIAFWRGRMHHGRLNPLLLGLLGMLFLLVALASEGLGFEGVEKNLTVGGSVLLSLGHILNLKFS